MRKKYIKKIAIPLLFCLTGVLLPMTAHAKDTPGAYLIGAYDEGIKPEEGDALNLSVFNSSTGKSEKIVLDLTKNESEVSINVDPGTYYVSDIVYEGGNETIFGNTIAVASPVVVSDAYDYLYFAIGEKETDVLQFEFNNVFVKNGDEISTSIEGTDEDVVTLATPESPDVDSGAKDDVKDSDETTAKEDQTVKNIEKEADTKPVDEPVVQEGNKLLGFLPILVFGIGGGITLYVLHKKKII